MGEESKKDTKLANHVSFVTNKNFSQAVSVSSMTDIYNILVSYHVLCNVWQF